MSYFEESVKVDTLVGGIEFTSANSSRFVVMDATGRAVYPAAGAAVYGVMTTNQAVDTHGRVVYAGTVPVEIAPGETFAIGDTVGSDAQGRAVAGGNAGIVRHVSATWVAVKLNSPFGADTPATPPVGGG